MGDYRLVLVLDSDADAQAGRFEVRSANPD